MKNVLVSALTAAAVGACFYAIGPLLAARNSSGTMAAVNGPYIAGTTIDQAQVNARLADIENEITDSKSRSGKGDFSAAVRGVDGTVAAPAYSFTSETGTGWYRAGANDVRFALSGTAKAYWSTVGLGLGGAAVTFPFEVRTAVGTTNAQFGTTTPAYLVDGGGLGLNLYYDGANWKYGATAAGANLNVDTAGGFIIYTTPSGTAGTAATLTERARINVNGLTIGSGGTAISKSVRGTYSVTPANMGSATCEDIVNTATLTGAAVGADCVVTPPSIGSFVYSCAVINADTVNARVCTPVSTGGTPPSGVYKIRVFNP